MRNEFVKFSGCVFGRQQRARETPKHGLLAMFGKWWAGRAMRKKSRARWISPRRYAVRAAVGSFFEPLEERAVLAVTLTAAISRLRDINLMRPTLFVCFVKRRGQ